MSVLSEQKKKSLLVFAAVIVFVLFSTFLAVHFLNSDTATNGTPIPDRKPEVTANGKFNPKKLLNQSGKSTNNQNGTNVPTINTGMQSSYDEDPGNTTLSSKPTDQNGGNGGAAGDSVNEFSIEKFNSDLLFKANDNSVINLRENNIEQPEFIDFLQTPELRKKDGFVGIANKGNSCYADSILQMLYRVPNIRKFIGNLQAYSLYIDKEINCAFEICCKIGATDSHFHYEDRVTAAKFMVGLNHIFYQLQNNPAGKPAEFSYKKSIQSMPGKFALNDQQDSDEYFFRVFNFIEYFLPDKQKSTIYSLLQSEKIKDGKKVVSYEHLSHLSLKIPRYEANIHNALKQYMTDESGAETRKLVSIPEILPIQLLRIIYDKKIETPVEMPLELETKDFYTPGDEVANKSTLFRLKMFVRHIGQTAKSGHYIAYSLENDGKWIILNDSNVSNVNEREVIEAAKESYYFFYEKI